MNNVSRFAVRLLTSSLLSWTMLSSTAAAADDAQAVLASARARYAKLSSYQDTGVIEQSTDWDIPFTTSFVRPGRVRIEWTTRHPFPLLYFVKWTTVLLTDGASVRLRRSNVDRDDVEPTWELGVAAATGISVGLTHHVATLFDPHLFDGAGFGTALLDMPDAQYRDIVDVDGVRCDHLVGHAGKRSVELWIGADDHLVRRIDVADGPFRSSEHHRMIRADVDVPPGTFTMANAR